MIDRVRESNRTVSEYLASYVPESFQNKLKQEFSSAKDLEKAVSWQEDVSHRLPHVLETMSIFHFLSEAYEVGPKEQDWGMRSIKLHDSGYRLAQQGIIDTKEHHLGSLFVASVLDPDVNVFEAIRLHVSDILPENVPFWLRLVRDADRISSLGFTGANRLSVFFARKKFGKTTPEQDIKSGIYCELGACPDFFDNEVFKVSPERYWGVKETAAKYEKKAEKHFIHKVLPALFKNGELRDFCDHMKDVLSWFEGAEGVEPVVDKARKMYSSRAAVTRNISTIYHRVACFPMARYLS